MKLSLSIVLFIVILSGMYIWMSWPDDQLHIVMCDVGQGDAVLATIGFQQLLIDAGPNDKILQCLQQYIPFWDRHIEVLILSHDDADHAAGIREILPYFTIGIFFRNQPYETTELSKLLENDILSYQINTQPLTQGNQITLKSIKEDVHFITIWPDQSVLKNKEKTETKHNPNSDARYSFEMNDNNLSISGYLSYGEWDMLLTGDIDSQVEQALIEGDLIKDVDVVKIPHHGSKYSSSESFLASSRPETALVGVGKKNPFGHPATRVTDILRYSNITTYLTSTNGNIEIISDGQSFTVHPTREN